MILRDIGFCTSDNTVEDELDCSWVVLLGDWPDNPMREARLRTDGTWLVLRDTDFQAMARAAGDLNLNL